MCFGLSSFVVARRLQDVPYAIALYGLTCFPKMGCCLKLGDIAGNAASQVSVQVTTTQQQAAGAPSTVELEALPVIATKAEEVNAPKDMEMSREDA